MGWFENCYTSQVDELLPGYQTGAKQPAVVVDVVPVVVAVVVATVEAVGEGAEKGGQAVWVRLQCLTKASQKQ